MKKIESKFASLFDQQIFWQSTVDSYNNFVDKLSGGKIQICFVLFVFGAFVVIYLSLSSKLKASLVNVASSWATSSPPSSSSPI